LTASSTVCVRHRRALYACLPRATANRADLKLLRPFGIELMEKAAELESDISLTASATDKAKPFK
jgi:hypothetical protein